jgi:hypothetical protein
VVFGGGQLAAIAWTLPVRRAAPRPAPQPAPRLAEETA